MLTVTTAVKLCVTVKLCSFFRNQENLVVDIEFVVVISRKLLIVMQMNLEVVWFERKLPHNESFSDLFRKKSILFVCSHFP